MKKMICLLTGILFMATQVFSTNPITEDQGFAVVAGSGLKMRTTPSLESQVVKIIPFGDMVYEVVDSSMTNLVEDRIEWMEGEWIKVEHLGDQGYVFNGFLTGLPIPQFDFEFTFEDLELSSPLEAWINYRFDRTGEPSIYENDEEVKLVTDYIGGHRKIEIDTPYMFKISFLMSDVEMHEIYNVMKGMMTTGYEKKSFVQNSLFIENKFGDINRIKVNLESPITIKQLAGNQVQVTITNFYDGTCGL